MVPVNSILDEDNNKISDFSDGQSDSTINIVDG